MRKLIGYGFIVIGAFFLVFGLYFTYQRINFLGICLEAKGVVVDFQMEEEHDPDTGWETVYIPVFQFTDEGTGEQVNGTGSVGNASPAYDIGQEVDILYKSGDPNAGVIVKSFWDLWLPSILCIPSGSGAIIMGLYILRR